MHQGNTEMKTIFDDKGVKIKDVPVYIFKNKDGNAVAINGVVLKIWKEIYRYTLSDWCHCWKRNY